MSEQNETQDGAKESRTCHHGHHHRGRRWIKAGVAIALLGTLAVAAGITFANNGGACHGHFGRGMHDRMNPAKMSERIDHMVNRILADGTPEQKAKVTAILKGAMTDLGPLHAQHKVAHEQAFKLLTQPTIDRDALEKLRTAQIRLADQASTRIVQALADAAEVLTPEQRVKLAEHFKKRMG
jgi:protein CpxP